MRRESWHPGLPGVGPSVAAVGVFDGVHLGHQALLRDAVALARSQGVQAAVLTFEPDPEAVLHPTDPPPRILSADDRAAAIAALGVDALIEVPFDNTLAAMPADAFVDEIVEPALDPVALVVGEDFRFASQASGDVSTLALHGDRHGYRVLPQELTVVAGAPVTATRIRDLVVSGDVEAAANLLGRPHFVREAVVRGRQLGSRLDAPTANLNVPTGTLTPADGVYAGIARTGGAEYAAAISVGDAPSFASPETGGDATLVEAHLVGFSGDLVGQRLEIAFVARLRDQHSFSDEDSLRDAIHADIQRTRELLGR